MVRRYIDGRGQQRCCGGRDLRASQAYPRKCLGLMFIKKTWLPFTFVCESTNRKKKHVCISTHIYIFIALYYYGVLNVYKRRIFVSAIVANDNPQVPPLLSSGLGKPLQRSGRCTKGDTSERPSDSCEMLREPPIPWTLLTELIGFGEMVPTWRLFWLFFPMANKLPETS